SSFVAGAQGTNTINYTLPTAIGSANQVLAISSVSGNAAQLGWASGSGSGWGLTGNSGTTFGTNFLGTTDNVDLQFRVYNVQAGVIQSAYWAGNTVLGYGVLENNTTGTYNTANGWGSLNYNTSGAVNAAYGSLALNYNTTGSEN